MKKPSFRKWKLGFFRFFTGSLEISFKAFLQVILQHSHD